MHCGKKDKITLKEKWLSKQTESYPHPFSRYVVDLLTAIVLTKSKNIADIGSKYHKIEAMYNYSFLAYRGVMTGYDSTYLRDHKPRDNTRLIKELVNETTLMPSGSTIISIDTIYYPGVYECIV